MLRKRVENLDLKNESPTSFACYYPRSLRLNFESNLECYDQTLASQLAALVTTRIGAARACTLADVDSRKLPIKLRDGFARLLSPFL